MMEKKQTAVEWLIEELKALDWWYLPNSIKKDIFDQAKAMEKEQIIDTFVDVTKETLKTFGIKSTLKDVVDFQKIAEVYYNEEFKSE